MTTLIWLPSIIYFYVCTKFDNWFDLSKRNTRLLNNDFKWTNSNSTFTTKPNTKYNKTRTTIVVSNGRYTFIKYTLSNTIYQIPFIKYCLSNTIYLISFIKYYLSNTIFCQKSNSHFFNESMNELTECL